MKIAILGPVLGSLRQRKNDYQSVSIEIHISKAPVSFVRFLKKNSLSYLNIFGCSRTVFTAAKGYVLSGSYKNLIKFCTDILEKSRNSLQEKAVYSIYNALLNYKKDRFDFICRKYKINLFKRPHIMGVLNVTPDSFSDGGAYFDKMKALAHALAMEKEGADIIDIGAQSTRPEAASVKSKEQLKRIEKIVRILGRKLKVPISIDTSSSIVAERCLDLGASIINDISALRKDKKLGFLIAKYKAGVVLMHMKGTPRTMQRRPDYRDLIAEIINFLDKAKEKAYSYGIKEEQIILDPGIGFGKTTEHNLKIIKFLPGLKILGSPILIGTSRKSFIGDTLKTSITDREFGTAASVAFSILNGANIVRVHNVRQMKQVISLTEAINNQSYN